MLNNAPFYHGSIWYEDKGNPKKPSAWDRPQHLLEKLRHSDGRAKNKSLSSSSFSSLSSLSSSSSSSSSSSTSSFTSSSSLSPQQIKWVFWDQDYPPLELSFLDPPLCKSDLESLPRREDLHKQQEHFVVGNRGRKAKRVDSSSNGSDHSNDGNEGDKDDDNSSNSSSSHNGSDSFFSDAWQFPAQKAMMMAVMADNKMPSTRRVKKKQSMCRYFNLPGGCHYGDSCIFGHDPLFYQRVKVPQYTIGVLIGKRGITRRRIEIESGAESVSVISSSEEVVITSTTQEHVNRAVELVNEIVKECKMRRQLRGCKKTSDRRSA